MLSGSSDVLDMNFLYFSLTLGIDIFLIKHIF